MLKRMVSTLSFLFLLCLARSAAQAQDALTQTYTPPEGTFSVMYPAGWTADNAYMGAGFVQFSSGPSLANFDAFAPLVSGDMGVALYFLPENNLSQDLIQMRVAEGPMQDIVSTLSLVYGHPASTIEDFALGSFPAVRGVTSSSDTDSEMIGVDFGNGTQIIAVGVTFKGELANLDATMLAMLATASISASSGEVTTTETEATAIPTSAPTEAAAAAVPTTTLSLQPTLLWTDDTFGFPASGLAFSADDTTLLVGAPLNNSGADTDLTLADAATGNALFSPLTGLERVAGQVAFSPDGSTVAGISTEALVVWDVASSAVTATIQMRQYEGATNVAFNPVDGALLYITQANPEDTLWQLDLATGQPEAIYTVTDRNSVLQGMAFSPDGSSVLVGLRDYRGDGAHATVYQIDLVSHDATKLFDHAGANQVALLYPAEGQPLIAVNPDDTDTTQVWDITSDTALYTLPEAQTQEGHPVATTVVAINPAGTILATASIGVEAQLWDAKTGAPLGTLDRNLQQMQSSEPYGFAFTHQGNRLAVFYGNRQVSLWSLDGSGTPTAVTTDNGATSPTEAPTATATAADTTAAACTITASGGANLRSGAGTTFAVAGSLAAGDSQSVIGQATGGDGFVWWKLESGSWVRSDLVQTNGDCTTAPTVAS